MKAETLEKLKELIKNQEEQGKIVFVGLETLCSADIETFLNQPTEGVLYDLNRLPEVIMTWTDDSRWINDYATILVIKYLKKFYDEHKEGKNGN